MYNINTFISVSDHISILAAYSTYITRIPDIKTREYFEGKHSRVIITNYKPCGNTKTFNLKPTDYNLAKLSAVARYV